MDDFKRQMYMQVLDELYKIKEHNERVQSKDKSNAYCCVYLCREIANLIGLSYTHYFYWHTDSKPIEIMEDIFPEFLALYDNRWHSKVGYVRSMGSNDAWWDSTWMEPRIRIIEYLLNK